jgi:hypothetical protein
MPPQPPEPPDTVHGVDFSGGRSAGNNSWVASGALEDGSLKIDDCRTGSSLPNSSTQRDPFLDALRDWIRDQGSAAIGLDFPFGMPEELVDEDNWYDFVVNFPKRHQDADAFRMACQRASPGAELKRETDEINDTPFSPYNLRMYKQTYHGIADVLAPLVREEEVCVLPMMEPEEGKPWLLEVCPGSTMRAQGHKVSYKGTTQEHRAARTRILKNLQGSGTLTIRAQGVLSNVLRDGGGDALDAVISAFAATTTVIDEDKLLPGGLDGPEVEGHVYA